MTHPSTQRARQILDRRAAQEAEHEAWREQHADELSDARLEQLRAARNRRVQKEFAGDLIYKTIENAVLPPPAEPANSEPALSVKEFMRFCDDIGAETTRWDNELRAEFTAKIDQLAAEVARLKKQLLGPK
jgi:hypothetical protein